MGSTITVPGGTENLGRHVVPLLRAAGRDVRVLSRHGRKAEDGVEYVECDLLAGDGLDEALRRVQTVVHLAGGPKHDEVATRNLVEAAEREGVWHIVLISVIAADAVPLGYFRAKMGAEQAVIASGIPHTILRAAQFDDLAYTVAHAFFRSPIVPVPDMRWQPVDVREVVARLAELALGEPAGRVWDLASPRDYTLRELVYGYLAAEGKHRMLMPIRMPGKAGRVYLAGENLAGADADEGRRTWEEFLGEKASA